MDGETAKIPLIIWAFVFPHVASDCGGTKYTAPPQKQNGKFMQMNDATAFTAKKY